MSLGIFLELNVNFHKRVMCFLLINLVFRQMNDLVRDKLRTTDGHLPLWAEVLAGCTVSGCLGCI